MNRTGTVLVATLAALAVTTCGGGGSTSPGPTDVTVSVTADGPRPVEVTVPRGGRVTFTNSDVRSHAVSSDPIQTHTDCPALNEVGTINPGTSRTTGTLDVARVCGYHDHNNETDPTFKGRIVVQ
jgi:plastocyanin